MQKRKKLNRLSGLVPTRNYENYNPLQEEDKRFGRRFGLGLVASIAVNALILGGAGVMANHLTPPSKEAPPVEITFFPTPKEEPTPVKTPAPAQVAQATPPPPTEMQMPEPERQREPDRERVRPTPPPQPKERVQPTPPPRPREPVQVTMAEKPEPIPTPEPVTTPPPKLDEVKTASEVTVKSEAAQERKNEAATSAAQRVAQIPEATTQAKALKSEMGRTDGVTAPTRNRSLREPIGASTTVASRSKSLAELKEEANAAGGGNPVSVSAAGAAGGGNPGAGAALNARAVSATSASNIQNGSLQTASAGNASVLDNTPTRNIRGPIASTGPLSARSKVLQSMSSDADDSNAFSFVQGGTVTAGKVVGTQGATARGTVITSASGVAQPQFAGERNGITVATPGGMPIRGPRVAAGSPGLSGPRVKAIGPVALGGDGGQIGTPGNFNSASPGGGGVSGSGTGGSGGVGGSGSLRARGGGDIGSGGGSGGGALRAQTSGADAVASSRPGRPNNGRLAANGSTSPTAARGAQLSTTSIGGLEGPSGSAGDVDGTPGGQGRAGKSTGRSGAVDGAATGGNIGAKTGSGGNDTVASNGEGGRGTAIRAEKADTSGPGSKLQKSSNAEATFRPEPDIPDSMRSEQFATNVAVHVTIDENGRASYDLTRSSGSSVIDRLVTQTLRRWKWKAAIRNGAAVSSETDITVSLRVK
jgi:TonB family protein